MYLYGPDLELYHLKRIKSCSASGRGFLVSSSNYVLPLFPSESLLQKARQAGKAGEMPSLQQKNIRCNLCKIFYRICQSEWLWGVEKAYSLSIIFPIAQRSFTSSHLLLKRFLGSIHAPLFQPEGWKVVK